MVSQNVQDILQFLAVFIRMIVEIPEYLVNLPNTSHMRIHQQLEYLPRIPLYHKGLFRPVCRPAERIPSVYISGKLKPIRFYLCSKSV